MAEKLFLELVSPEKLLVSEEVDEVYAPGTEGDLGILPNHITFFCSLRQGEFYYKIGPNIEYVALDGGFLEVIDNKVTVLADGAELGKDLNLDEVLRRKANAEKELQAARKEDSATFSALEVKLKRELLRVDIAKYYKDR